VPIFPELRPYLDSAWNDAEPGEEFVVSRRRKNVTLRTQFERIIKNAGLKPWPKLFQNLRSTRETELINQGHPIHVVCSWLGNTASVALEHYAQVRDEDFAKAGTLGLPAMVQKSVHRFAPIDTNGHQTAHSGVPFLSGAVEFAANQWAIQDSNL